MIIMAPPLYHKIAKPDWPDQPPWHVVGSRELARLLGVGVQVLGDWRARGIGPEPVPEGVYRRGPGGRRLYRISEVMRWYDSLQDVHRDAWRYDADYLKTALRIEEDLNEAQVENLKRVDWTGMIPNFPQPRKIRDPCIK